MKRARGGEHRSQGGAGRGGAGRGSATKSDGPTKKIEDPSAIKGNNTVEKIEINEGFANTRWTDDERTKLFNYYLTNKAPLVCRGTRY
jgi:hypothetical protein